MDTTGTRIKKLRLEHGMSQEELAKRLGYSHKSAINKIELNINGVPSSKIVMLSKIFGVSISYLLCDDEHKPRTESVCLSPDEKNVILAYRAHPEMQDAVNRLLGIEKQPEKKLSPTVSDIKPAQKTYIVRTAGRGEGVKDVEMTAEEIEFYKNLPDVDETDL